MSKHFEFCCSDKNLKKCFLKTSYVFVVVIKTFHLSYHISFYNDFNSSLCKGEELGFKNNYKMFICSTDKPQTFFNSGAYIFQDSNLAEVINRPGLARAVLQTPS